MESVTATYGPCITGEDPTEVFVIELDGEPVGLIQRYRHDDFPEWKRAVGGAHAAGIDYLVGEPGRVGQGVGTAAIAVFAADTLVRYPDVDCVVAAPNRPTSLPGGPWRKPDFSGCGPACSTRTIRLMPVPPSSTPSIVES